LLFAIHLKKLKFKYDTSELKSVKCYKIIKKTISDMYSGTGTYLHYIQQ